uniref:Uncharacterized protein n=1 Tax=Bionectria ochroleuca TaxID=29856 RepID=A0A8H7NKF9_BIOOC
MIQSTKQAASKSLSVLGQLSPQAQGLDRRSIRPFFFTRPIAPYYAPRLQFDKKVKKKRDMHSTLNEGRSLVNLNLAPMPLASPNFLNEKLYSISKQGFPSTT